MELLPISLEMMWTGLSCTVDHRCCEFLSGTATRGQRQHCTALLSSLCCGILPASFSRMSTEPWSGAGGGTDINSHPGFYQWEKTALSVSESDWIHSIWLSLRAPTFLKRTKLECSGRAENFHHNMHRVFFAYFSVDGHLGWFWNLAIWTSPEVITYVQVF